MTISEGYKADMTSRHDARTSWGNSARNYGGADVLGLLDRFDKLKTVLDFGCGKGTMKEYVMARLNRQDVTWTEYDPGIPALATVPQGRYDMVVTCDVLEHLEPRLLDETLLQLADWTQVLSYHNIACTETKHVFKSGEYEGQDIHLIVEKPTWWLDRLETVFRPDLELWEFRDCLRRAKRQRYRERATIIHERTGNVHL